MAIIVDRNDYESIVMQDDHHGASVRIPSFLIGKKDGNILKEAIHQMTMEEIKQGKKTDADWNGSDKEKSPDTIEKRKFRDWANKIKSDRN